MELYYQREAEANKKREEAVEKRIQTLADYEKLCEESSKMWQNYLICIKYIKRSNYARRECEIVTLLDESDEVEDDDLAHCIIWKNMLRKKC